jgi:outer membrane receptor protein involved in Fe transport
MLINRILLGFLFMGLSSVASSQKGVLNGHVLDSTTRESIPYASLVLFHAKSHSMVFGVAADSAGNFSISNIEEGSYYVLCSVLGYHNFRSSPVKINDDPVSIGDIELIRVVQELEELEVTGFLPHVKYQVDKKVIDVSKQLSAQSGNAIDLLENSSSVQVSIDGNVLLRGSSNITVLVDGVPTIQSPSEILRQIPAKTIDQIEIITNPSSNYEANGTAGIINIIRKKDRLKGTSGYVNVVAGNFDRRGIDALLKFKNSKVDFYLGLDYNKRVYLGNEDYTQFSIDDGFLFSVENDGNYETMYETMGIRTGLDVHLSPRDVFGFELKVSDYYENDGSFGNIVEWNSQDSSTRNLNSRSIQESNSIDYEFTGVYYHQFSQKDHVIKATFDYQRWDFQDRFLNELSFPSGSLADGKINIEDAPANLYFLKVNYAQPFKNNQFFEAGLQSRLQFYHDKSNLLNFDTTAQEYFDDPDFAQETDYFRNIHSFFATWSQEGQKFEYKLGVRGEYTDRNIENTRQPEPFAFQRFNLFPSIHLMYKLSDEKSLYASYSRRIDRPASSWLEPFLTFRSAYRLTSGNPNLIPEYFDSFELGYLIKKDGFQLNVEGFYKYGINTIDNIRTVFSENLFLTRYENIGSNTQLGVELNSGVTLFSWWTVDLMANFSDYLINGEFEGVDLSNETTSWTIRFNQSFKFWKKNKIQINAIYNGPTVSAQGINKDNYYLNLMVKQTVWKDRFDVVLNVQDIFRSRVWEYDRSGPSFETSSEIQREAPIISVSVTYSFDRQKRTPKMP